MKSASLVCNLLLSSTLFWGVPLAYGEDLSSEEEFSSIPVEISGYCHMKYPLMREDSLSWVQPVFDDDGGKPVDFYGPCNHDPFGADEIRTEQRIQAQGFYGDGE